MIDNKPNLIIMGVAHSGTTILTRMLATLGWNALEALLPNAENIRVWEANQQLIAGETPNWTSIHDLVAGKSPWVIKDPHFCYTLDAWHPFRAAYNPHLIIIRRHRADVIASWCRRDEGLPDPAEHVDYAAMRCQRQYEEWPGPKMVINYEDLRTAVSMFSLEGGH